jgi:hypothetical protein
MRISFFISPRVVGGKKPQLRTYLYRKQRRTQGGVLLWIFVISIAVAVVMPAQELEAAAKKHHVTFSTPNLQDTLTQEFSGEANENPGGRT